MNYSEDTYKEGSDIQIDLTLLEKTLKDINDTTYLKELVFSTKEGEIKRKYYNIFNKYSKNNVQKVSDMFFGIHITEDNIPENMLICKFTGDTPNKICIYRDDVLFSIEDSKIDWERLCLVSEE